VGNIRTALFTWLVARHHGGKFIVRIEDTDQSRKVEGSVEVILQALRWLGLDWDEGPDIGGDYGPYVQSERLAHYQAAADRLIESGHAYRFEDERGSAVKFAMPKEGSTVVSDVIRDEIEFDNSLIGDFVILKSDGFPTYHLASVVDDHLMQISHVIRAEEWLPSAPRHVQLYKAFGWEATKFAHVPDILASDRSKLSKRHGAVSVLQYRQMGYLPHAMVNFLALLGWAYDDKTELFTKEALIEAFSLDRVSKSGAIFNVEKLDWMNGHYIREMSDNDLADALIQYWGEYPPDELPADPDRQTLVKIAPLIQERLKTLGDASERIPFFFNADFDYDASELVQRKMDEAGTLRALEESLPVIQSVEPFDAANLEEKLRPLADTLDIKVGQLLGTLRVATSGLKVSPPLFESMEILGRERVLRDINRAIEKLKAL
jgi:glutamyl-tRNA synthetase